MIYNPANLKRRVHIVGAIISDNSGFDDLEEKIIATVWADIQPIRGKQYYELETSATENQAKIIIRYRNNIKEDMKVIYKNHTYIINSVVDPFMDHESLELYCTEKLRGQN